ncbi:MAG: transcriptional repressor NrdR [Candidatus Woesearchaeota archaeon]|nr:transcriptional repressor NrdR [Candidatus Woesearchaeota archaeon]MDN5327480.1 transcriptional repressor NrdR [Candidatus Woesearchaeota archaeon]
MRCPFCGSDNTSVIDSREIENGYVIRRRRICEQCKRRFTTYEKFEIFVIKRDGREELFDKRKIIIGLKNAFKKSTFPSDKINQIADRIENDLKTEGLTRVSSSEIGKRILNYLKEIDEVAYVRFASVYFDFRNIEEFKKVFHEFTKKTRKKEKKV